MNALEAIVFVIHYFVFFLTVVLFLLKFHQKEKMKVLFYATLAIWILFGCIDFILALIRFIAVFG